ncbi:MAG: SAM-dependent methyltransferase, partial [Actinobacteria bacterium]|nr:SAM-dependent methyltransferase [Actinomycetota bacterium]
RFRSFFWSRAHARFASLFLTRGPMASLYYSLSSRTKYIDDCLERSLDESAGQVVILGAGFDARPYRFERLKRGTKVFEVDFPATQQVKIRRIEKAIGCLPEHIKYVPVDFEQDDFGQRLFDFGYDRELKTLFIWEGVMMYLTPGAVDDTLAFVTGSSPQGSSIVFTFSRKPVKPNPVMERIINFDKNVFMKRREPFLFTVKEGELEGFLLERGLVLKEELSTSVLADRYLKTGFWKLGMELSGIAQAYVK